MGNYSLMGGDVMMSQSSCNNWVHQRCNSGKINWQSNNWNNVMSPMTSQAPKVIRIPLIPFRKRAEALVIMIKFDNYDSFVRRQGMWGKEKLRRSVEWELLGLFLLSPPPLAPKARSEDSHAVVRRLCVHKVFFSFLLQLHLFSIYKSLRRAAGKFSLEHPMWRLPAPCYVFQHNHPPSFPQMHPLALSFRSCFSSPRPFAMYTNSRHENAKAPAATYPIQDELFAQLTCKRWMWKLHGKYIAFDRNSQDFSVGCLVLETNWKIITNRGKCEELVSSVCRLIDFPRSIFRSTQQSMVGN